MMLRTNGASLFSLILAAAAFSCPTARAGTFYVPDDHAAIQTAIASASHGDIIIVRAGTYQENLDFLGKALTVRSEDGPRVTRIDGGAPSNPDIGSVVRFENGEGPGSVLEGFTLTNGTGTADGWRRGGGVLCQGGASPTIRGNTITRNTAHYGAGICLRGGSSPRIENNVISDNAAGHEGGGIFGKFGVTSLIEGNRITGNSAGYGGGGIRLDSGGPSEATIRGNAIGYNKASYDGGGILCTHDVLARITDNVILGNESLYTGGGIACKLYADGNGLLIENNLFVGNRANNVGGGFSVGQGGDCVLRNNTFVGNLSNLGHSPSGGIFCGSWTDTVVENCIFRDNDPGDIDLSIYADALVVSHSNVETGWPGTGNISADPQFVPGPSGFYYLSQIAAGQGSDSPCVDTGSDLAVALNLDHVWTRTDEMADAGLVDMGYHHGPFPYPYLHTDVTELSVGGGVVRLLLDAPARDAHRGYFLLGSISGTDPGQPLPGGLTILPLNFDEFTQFVLELSNTTLFADFIGTLDAAASGTAEINAPPLPPTAVGVTMSFAYCLNHPFDLASNAVSIRIVP